jgi:uncharacterized protein
LDGGPAAWREGRGEWEVQIILLGSLIAGMAALSQALTGFGFALVLVPLLNLLLDAKMVVIISISLGLVSKVPILVQDWRHVEPRRIAPLSVAAIVGSVVGVQLLLNTNANVLKVAIGVVVVAFAIPMLLDYRRPARREGLATLIVGLVSGILNGSTSMGGPPVVLLGVNQAWSKVSFRANLVAFFVISNVSTLAMLSAAGAFTSDVIQLDLILVPAVLVGIVVGGRLFAAIPAERFRKFVVLLVIASGLLSTWTGVQSLLH